MAMFTTLWQNFVWAQVSCYDTLCSVGMLLLYSPSNAAQLPPPPPWSSDDPQDLGEGKTVVVAQYNG